MTGLRERGSGRPLVFLHGWTCHGGYFQPQLDGLSEDYHVLAPDLPGHGDLAHQRPWSIEGAADHVASLLNARALKDVVLVGWSMGAIIAWSMLQRHGLDGIAGVATIDMTPRVLNDDTWTLGTKDGLTRDRNDRVVDSMPSDWPRIARRISQTIFAENALNTAQDPALNEWVRQEIEKNDPKAMASLWQSLVDQDFRAFQKEMPLPTLLLHGAGSQIYTPAVGEWQESNLPNAELVLLNDTGHAPHMERPDAFNEVLARFCRCL